jgi:hypothetical protein
VNLGSPGKKLFSTSLLCFYFGGISRHNITDRDCQKGRRKGEGDAVDDKGWVMR